MTKKWKYEIIETSPSGKKTTRAYITLDTKISTRYIKQGMSLLKQWL